MGVKFGAAGARQVFGVAHLEAGGKTWDSPWILLEAIDGLEAAAWSEQVASANAARDVLYAVTELVAGREPTPDAARALEDETAAVRQKLLTLDRKLLERLDGAFGRARVGGPDAMSQGAHSLQETIYHLLRRLAPDKECLEWSKAHFPTGVRDGDKLTRPARVRFVCAALEKDPAAALRLADVVQELTAKLQGLKHGDQFTDPARVDELAHLTITWIGELLN
jgi:hypothetical protein